MGKYIIENYNDIEKPQDATRYYSKKKCEEEEEMDLVQLPDGQIDTVGNKITSLILYGKNVVMTLQGLSHNGLIRKIQVR